MRVTIFCGEVPYPPTHGARVDIWRRLRAFKRCGVDLQVVCWVHDLSESIPEALRAVAKSVVKVPIPRNGAHTIGRLPLLFTYPWPAARRTLWGEAKTRLVREVDLFSPDAIWVEGVWVAPTAHAVARSFGLPLFIRSHNVEHLYMRQQFRLARGLRQRIEVALACVNLRSFELRMLRCGSKFFDISVDDLAYWETQGLVHGVWLPPLISEDALRPRDLKVATLAEGGARVVFLGNLRTPNNVAGVLWLIHDVFPLIGEMVAGAKLVIAGSSPSKEVRDACSGAVGVELVVDPVDADSIRQSASVLVNPAPFSSGVNLKSIDMLYSGRPVVSTSVGLAGLPGNVKSYFRVADTAVGFAQAVIECLQSPIGRAVPHDVVDRAFGDSVVQATVTLMNEVARGKVSRSGGAARA